MKTHSHNTASMTEDMTHAFQSWEQEKEDEEEERQDKINRDKECMELFRRVVLALETIAKRMSK